jgi:ribosomal protein S4
MYRTGFITSMFEIIPFIRKGNILVNKRLINYLNYRVKVGDLIQFKKSFRKRARMNYHRRRLFHTFIMSIPRFIYANFPLFYLLIERLPREKDLVFPIKLDMYRATGFY